MTTQHIKIIDRKKLTRVELNKYSDMFLVYIVFFSILLIYLILKTQINLLLTEKVIIIAKYFDFIDMFLKIFAIKLFKYLGTYNFTIELKRGKQISYRLIYSF